MISDRIQTTVAPDTSSLPVNLNLIREKAFIDTGYQPDETVVEYVKGAIEAFEQETDQVLLRQALTARFSQRMFKFETGRLEGLEIPGFKTAILSVTDGGKEVTDYSSVKDRFTESLTLYPNSEWSGEGIDVSFTAGLLPTERLKYAVVDILGIKVRASYLGSAEDEVLFLNALDRYRLRDW